MPQSSPSAVKPTRKKTKAVIEEAEEEEEEEYEYEEEPSEPVSKKNKGTTT